MKALFATFVVRIFLLTSQVEGACDSELGMKNKTIRDDKITASSSLSANNAPHFARLDNREGAWCSANTDNTPYLQIDLEQEKLIRAITTQGSQLKSRWVKKFKIKYRKQGQWSTYKEKDGTEKVFQGNVASRSLKKNVLAPSITTHMIRIYPTESFGAIQDSSMNAVTCLRVELHGCSTPVDGGWGEWGNWSKCSVTCGLGMQSRERKCDSPKPQNGGRPCNEEEKVHKKFCRERKCGEYVPGYSGSGYGWETSSGDGSRSDTKHDGWEEYSGSRIQGDNDDEDY